MKKGIEQMARLGFVETTGEHDSNIVRQFTKYDDEGYITNTINYMYNGNDVEVFTNNLKNECGSRLDKDRLNAVIINFYELEEELYLDYLREQKKYEI